MRPADLRTVTTIPTIYIQLIQLCLNSFVALVTLKKLGTNDIHYS